MQEVLNEIKDKIIPLNIFRIPSNDSIMCRFHCIACTEYVIAGNILLGYTNLFSPTDYKKNDKVKYKYFKEKHGETKCRP